MATEQLKLASRIYYCTRAMPMSRHLDPPPESSATTDRTCEPVALMACFQPCEHAGTPHRHRSHILPHIRYIRSRPAAVAITNRIAFSASCTVNASKSTDLNFYTSWLSTGSMTKSHLQYVHPTAPHSPFRLLFGVHQSISNRLLNVVLFYDGRN